MSHEKRLSEQVSDLEKENSSNQARISTLERRLRATKSYLIGTLIMRAHVGDSILYVCSECGKVARSTSVAIPHAENCILYIVDKR